MSVAGFAQVRPAILFRYSVLALRRRIQWASERGVPWWCTGRRVDRRAIVVAATAFGHTRIAQANEGNVAEHLNSVHYWERREYSYSSGLARIVDPQKQMGLCDLRALTERHRLAGRPSRSESLPSLPKRMRNFDGGNGRIYPQHGPT